MKTSRRAIKLGVATRPAIPLDGLREPIEKISILLADDNAIVRQGLCSLLEAASDFKVVGQARDGHEAVELAQTLRPDVILMDIAMPVLNGLQATRQILATNPAAKVLVLSAHSDDEYIEYMTAVGAAGFLEKQTSAEILTKAIHDVVKGHRVFSPAIAKRMTGSKNSLQCPSSTAGWRR